MVVMVMISIGAVLSWTSLSDARKRTQVDNACENVAVMANKARSYALNGIDGMSQVRIECTNASGACVIQNFDTVSWKDISGESYALQNVVLESDFSVVYDIPYATGSVAAEASRKIRSSGDPSIKKDLIISSFKASCQ